MIGLVLHYSGRFMPFVAATKSRYSRVFSVLKSVQSLLSAVIAKYSPSSREGQHFGMDPLPFDSSNPAVPVSYPLKTLEELESRAYFESFHFPFNQATVRLDAAGLPSRPRILVCHDMAGGYKDDSFVQGGTNADAYAIWHWHLIDVFVYFSHSLVTLPPPCWTNAAHRHGVKVLGTFIIEWDEGKAVASKLLLTNESVHMYADRLTELAASLCFDGWLINMEVKLEQDQIPNLKEFISYLTRAMHSAVPGSLVLWYDSVTVYGDLSWQNQLNYKNKHFFDLCDGIFMNYGWKGNFAEQSGGVAGERKFDVYMGIDVFGRGTFGGGRWTTNLALDVIKKANVSAAIFAPGWVYETQQPPNFQTAQNRWWGLVEKSWGILRCYPRALPFYSNFDQGRGYHICDEGKQVSAIHWNNISSQTLQPLLENQDGSVIQPIKVSIDFSESSYNGGGNVTFVGSLDDGAEYSTRLFLGDLLIGKTPIHFKYSVRANANSRLGIALEFSSPTGENLPVLLAAHGNTLSIMNQFSNKYARVIIPHRVSKHEDEPEWLIQETSLDLPGHVLRQIKAVCYKPASSPELSSYYAVLGDVSITNGDDDTNFSSADSWLVEGEFIRWTPGSGGSKTLSLKIIWKLKVGNADNYFPMYNIYMEVERDEEYLGVAFVNCFYVSEVNIPCDVRCVKFIVQACGFDGSRQNLEDSPFLLVSAP